MSYRLMPYHNYCTLVTNTMQLEWDEDKNTSKTDWEALARMSDAEIDYSDIAPLTEEFFQHARLWKPHQRVQVTVEMDADVLEWFQAEDDDWEARLQAALRLYIETHKAYQQT